jgi:sodium/bile acid cotransporter 7
MAKVLFSGPTVGAVVLPLMLFHQIQLMVCAVLAQRWNTRACGEAKPQAASEPAAVDVR